ncbi:MULTISPECIES: hypothetical protein [unclassified Nocardiopsis]|uniref:hypothetical protein n=1 Tax=unclassified Nocardiopsis TaxID=2649073 RepID=UPI001300E102|nr:hypothetical protein [Nocardiopsis sp. TSRI0078]
MRTVSGKRLSLASAVGRGVLAGLAGTLVMTAFQKFVQASATEMVFDRFLDPARPS